MVIACLLFTGAAVAAMLAAYARDARMPAGVLKMIASTGFLAVALASGAFSSEYGRMVFAALFMSWWGDLFLIFRKKAVFLAGLFAFFLGHVAFAAAFIAYGVNPMWTTVTIIVLILPAIFVLRWVNPNLGRMRIPVYAYVAVISIMVALSAGAVSRAGSPFFMIAAVLFYISDVFVARDRFIVADEWNRFVGLPLYYAAQTIFAYTVGLVL